MSAKSPRFVATSWMENVPSATERAAEVEPLGLEDLEPGAAQLVHHLRVGVLVVVVGVDEPRLLDPTHPGVGCVEGEVAAGAQDPRRLRQDACRPLRTGTCSMLWPE